MRDARRVTKALAASVCFVASVVCLVVARPLSADQPARKVDPAAWGNDHVGRPFPEYVTGDECLFCHRKIGPTWNDNRHQLTVRPARTDDPALVALRAIDPEAADETRLLMGDTRVTRFLKRSSDYGKLELHSSVHVLGTNTDQGTSDRFRGHDPPRWDHETFGDRCAGCHTTAVNSRTRAFSTISLDCFTCHGDVPLEHSKTPSLALLSGQNREARVVTSICGQCHLRGGKARSTGLPYPDTFVAGDNLLRDFQVDLSEGAIRRLPAIERHVFRNVRDVAVLDHRDVTCLSCHDVHGRSSERHKELEDATICSTCHVPNTQNTELRDSVSAAGRRGVHSRVCGY